MKMFHSLNEYLLNTLLSLSPSVTVVNWIDKAPALRAYILMEVVVGDDGDFRFINDSQKIKLIMRVEYFS